MSDVDLDFDNFEMFDTSYLQTEDFNDGTSSCSSMGQNKSFVKSSIQMETIFPDNTMDSESVSKVFPISDFLFFSFKIRMVLCSCLCRL